MIVQDNRVADPTWQSLDVCSIGDLVETTEKDICLVVWSDKAGRPSEGNPGYNGLVSLKSGYVYVRRESFRRVRKLKGRLMIDGVDS